MINKLITILMDDYKDATMLVDYACEAKEHGYHELSTYFASRAKHRLADAKEVERHIDDMGDANTIHKAYKDYNDNQTEWLKKKIDKMM